MASAQDSGGVHSAGQISEEHRGQFTGISDVALVVAIIRGNRDAFAEVYRRHGGQAYGLAQRLCGGGQAEDVVQQVFLEMWEKPDRYDPDRGSLRTFLLTQVHGRSVDRLRTDGARRAREWASVHDRQPDAAGTETAVLTHLAADKVWHLVSALPVGQRDAIVLAYVEDYTYGDVAAVLKQPVGTIKSRIRAGLTQLRVALSQEGYQSSGQLG